MNLRSSLRSVLVVVVALYAARAGAQPQASRAPVVEAEVIRAALQFVDAVAAADEAVLRELIAASESSSAQRMARDLFIRTILAERRLEQVGAQRFGADGGAVLGSASKFVLSAQERQGLAQAMIYTDEAGPGGRMVLARVYMDGFTTPIRLRRDAEGRWQIILDMIEVRFDDDVALVPRGDGRPGSEPRRGEGRGDLSRGGPPGPGDGRDEVPRGPNARSQLELERMTAALKAIENITERVRNGEVASARAAGTELMDAIASINEQHRRKLSEIRRQWR